MEQQRTAGLEQQLHHAESGAGALAAETRVAQLDARQNEARAIDFNSIKNQQANRFRNFPIQFMAYCGTMDADVRHNGRNIQE